MGVAEMGKSAAAAEDRMMREVAVGGVGGQDY